MKLRALFPRTPDGTKSKLAKWRGLILVAILFIAVLTGLVLWKHVRIRTELARIRAAGEPVTPDDLARMYAVPEGENDTTELWLGVVRQLEPQVMRSRKKSLFDGMPFVGSDAEEPPLPGESWADQANVITLLDDFDQCLSDLHTAAKVRGSSAFLSSFDEGHNLPLPHVQNLGWASRLLRLEARMRAHQGDSKGAAESIDAIFSVGSSLAREPVAMTHLVRFACDASAREEIEQLLSVVDFSDDDLARFQEALRSADYSSGLSRAMLGERVLGIMTLRDPSSAGLSRTQSMAYRALGGEDMLRYLQVTREVVAAAQLPWPEALTVVQEIDRSNEIPKKELGSPGRGVWSLFNAPISAWGAASQWGSITPPFERTARALALNRAADAAIAVERFRRHHGRLPEQLQAVVPVFLPSVPDDPFSGKPIRYTQQEYGFVVYSVGVNGIDDDGQTDEIDVEHPLFGEVEKHPADFVFRVRRTPVFEKSNSGD